MYLHHSLLIIGNRVTSAITISCFFASTFLYRFDVTISFRSKNPKRVYIINISEKKTYFRLDNVLKSHVCNEWK